MAINLQTPILNARARSVNFFNGRLLTGEDLTAEQQANRAAHNLLGQAAGSGVVYGLEVKESVLSSNVQTPVLAVRKGLAFNRAGAALLLADDTEISLVPPATQSNGSTSLFQKCTPVQTGVFVACAGVYLLTIGPATAAQGLAEVSGISTAAAPCNSNYKAEGVQFRLIQFDLTQLQAPDANHLRNFIAYQCFGVVEQTKFISDPFNQSLASYGLLDKLRANQMLPDCEVPLAVLFWTATDGLVYIDMWSARRRLSAAAAGSLDLNSDRRVSEGDAMFLQFEDQVQSILNTQNSPETIAADSQFQFLPPAGILPVSGTGSPSGFNPQTFFAAHASQDIATTNGNLLREILHEALYHQPIELAKTGKIQLYLIWENLQAVKLGNTQQLALVFASAAMPYRGIARFGTAKWSLSRFAPHVI